MQGVGNAGSFINNGGAGAVGNGGSFVNNGSAGAVTNTGGATNNGTVASVAQNAGTFSNNAGGIVSGNVAVNGGGFANNAGATVSGGVAVNNTGTLTQTGLIGGNVTIATGGTVNATGGTVTGTTTNNGGALNINGGTFTGLVSNAAGTLTARGAVTGSITNAATMTVTSPDVLTLTGAISNTATGTFTTTGTTTTSGGLTSAGVVNAQGGLNSAVTNSGAFNVTGPLTATGQTFTNTGPGNLNIGTYSYTGIGTLTNGLGAVIGLGLGGSLGTTTLTNAGTVNANGANISGAITNSLAFNALATTITGTVTNSGAFDLSGGSVSGLFTNSGTLKALGNTTLSGGLVNTGTGKVDMLTPTIAGVPDFANATKDRLAINGNLSGGTYAMDVNLGSNLGVGILSNPNGGTSDQIKVTGNITGALHFDFTNAVPAGVGSYLGGPVLVLDGANPADPYTFTHTGLGAGGAVVYSLQRQGDDLNIVSQTSAGIGGIAANASLVQSLIGTVVNRPTSPFVSGLATEEGCSRGGYFRGTYGVSTVSGSSDNGISTTGSTVKASYAGAQGGYDYGCNDGRFFDGWDGSFGALVGYNAGKSDQNVEVPVGGGGTAVASITHSKFDQKYVGVYAAFSKDRITTDVQLRFERTDFTLNETVLPTFFGLGLKNAKFSTDSTNVTGRVSYRMDLNEDGLNFVPTAGLSYTHTSAATVNFSGGGNPAHRRV